MESEMRRWKRSVAVVAALGALWLGAGTAKAAGTSDSITVTITPLAAYSIMITSTPATTLGAVPLNTSTYTALASTVTINSTFQWTGLSLAAGVTSPSGTPWSLVSTNTSVQNGLSAWALFTDTSVVTAPAPAVLTSSNAVVGTGSFAVGAVGNSSCPSGTGTGTGVALFERQTAGATGLKHMECLPPASVDTYGGNPHLFLYFQTPPSTSDATHAQLVTFTLTAGAPL